jgi:hypothetical protein
MVIPDIRLSPVCSARANALRGQRRTADPIPNGLRVSTQLTLHPAAAIVKTCGSDLWVRPQRTSIGDLQSWEWAGRCSVQANRKRGGHSVGGCANCFGEQRASMTKRPFDLGSDETDDGRRQGAVQAGQDPQARWVTVLVRVFDSSDRHPARWWR